MTGMEDWALVDAIDWNEVWKAKKDRVRRARKGTAPQHRWDETEQARRYAREADQGYQARVAEEMALLPVTPESRVLDIGSGPGPLTIPLARKAAHVTAVEPAAGMVAVLAERVGKAGLSNVDWVEKTWEETDPDADLQGPYDVVLASFSLTMYDIRAALQKMDAVSCGSVYLFEFVDGPLWDRMGAAIWEDLHGEPYVSGPKADCLWNVLYQMGIYANVLMRPLEKTYRFRDPEEAFAFFAPRYDARTAGQGAVLRSYLAAINQADDGTFLYSRDSAYATIWWKKAHS
ncbi:MAG: class I SAM-dependent methyltransferase [Methanomicrobiaceae archaeon]|nr:class I SAM-dependent methyltransferase [Methanomicrobiaceae archaeon]